MGARPSLSRRVYLVNLKVDVATFLCMRLLSVMGMEKVEKVAL